MSAKRGPKMGEPSYERVEQFVRQHPRPFVETGEVWERFQHLDVSRKTVTKRLKDLEKKGRIEAKEIGPNAKVWYTQD